MNDVGRETLPRGGSLVQAIPSFQYIVLLLAFNILLHEENLAQAQSLGTWEVVVENAGIASMHTAVTHYGSVLLIDRTDIGVSQINLTGGACRNDPTEVALQHDCTAHSVLYYPEGVPYGGMIRPLTLETDTWCSSGQFVANGTMVQTGGDLDGNRKVRYFTPCPPGDTCDWVEAVQPELQEGRWYSTNQLLPDGRQIVIGGRDAFNLEFVPDNGEGLVSFPFLEQTNDDQQDNLYPYVHLLPNGNLFVFANNASVIYDYINNVIVQVFPDMPGGPRNYPSAGSSVMLPLLADDNYTTVEIIICGGAAAGAFLNPAAQLPATDTCGRLRITDPSPDWVMEEMPIRRCMGDMIQLPTRDILIINGAAAGSQGFGNAVDAVLNPVLYEPTAAPGSRFSILSPSTIPRVYHSTANLLPDGRILLAGSNTHLLYTFLGDFPTELRLDAFSPPYLSPEFQDLAPSIIIAPTVLGYNEVFSVTVFIATALDAQSSIQLNLLSAPFTTHSYAQGQRLLGLEAAPPIVVSNTTYQIIATTPPTPQLAPPTYYMLFAVNQGIPSAGAWVQISD